MILQLKINNYFNNLFCYNFYNNNSLNEFNADLYKIKKT